MTLAYTKLTKNQDKLSYASFMSLRNNKVFWARDMVQQLNAQVSYRGPSVNSQHLHDGSKPSTIPIPGDPMPSLASLGIRYIHGAQTCMQAKTYKMKKN